MIEPTIIIIIGISGDLAKRKLLPAIREIAKAGVLPEHFQIVGITRHAFTLKDILPEGDNSYLEKHLEMYQMDVTKADDYTALKDYLKKFDKKFGVSAQRLFYLSIPPQISQPIVELLGESGLAKRPRTKLLLEKPFGTDLASASELIDALHKYFEEDQLYRIDHYIAKEMAQNIIVFRSDNSLFRQTWNKNFVERIDIIASEKIGIEGRAVFYEQTGALRDVLQSHLLQLAALTLMDLPAHNDWRSIPAKRLDALRMLELATSPKQSALRGQYETYRNEVNNPHTSTETYVSVELRSRDKRWEGVPITLTTGKALNSKATTINIRYRQESSDEANELILKVHPNEGIEVGLWAKVPGYERKLQKLALKFSYDQHFNDLPEAYERVFVDAMRSDHSLFTTSDEVLAAWQLVAPVQHAWSLSTEDLTLYKFGSSVEEIAKLTSND